MTHVAICQDFNGLNVYDCNLQVNVTSEGEIINFHGETLSADNLAALPTEPKISALAAIMSAARKAGDDNLRTPVKAIGEPSNGVEKAQAFDAGSLSNSDLIAKLVYLYDNGT